MKTLLLATTVLFGACASAVAADAVMVDPPLDIVVTGFSWTGGYIGIHGGYSWADGDFEVPAGPVDSYLAESDLDGFLAGMHAGYSYQFDGGFMLGVEADADLRNGHDNANVTFSGNPTPLTVDSEINWSASARVRAGYAMDRFLGYITGGLAIADIESTTLANGNPRETFSDTYGGWTAGVGIEYAFTDSLIFRAEYRYTDFGDVDFVSVLNPKGTATYGVTSNDMLFGVSYKF